MKIIKFSESFAYFTYLLFYLVSISTMLLYFIGIIDADYVVPGLMIALVILNFNMLYLISFSRFYFPGRAYRNYIRIVKIQSSKVYGWNIIVKFSEHGLWFRVYAFFLLWAYTFTLSCCFVLIIFKVSTLGYVSRYQ